MYTVQCTVHILEDARVSHLYLSMVLLGVCDAFIREEEYLLIHVQVNYKVHCMYKKEHSLF